MKRFECKNCGHFRCVVFGTEVLSNKSFECKEKIFKTKWYEIAEEEDKKEIKTEEILNLPNWCKVGEMVYHKESNQFFKIATIDEEAKLIELEDNGWFCLDEFTEARLRPFNEKEMLELLGKFVKNKESKNVFLIHSVTDSEIGIGNVFYKKEVLLKRYTFTDGSLCGVYEHLENGEWVQ